MSYLSGPTSKTDYGVVLIGDYINVDNSGVISLSQDLSPNASVTFANVTDSALTDGRVTFAGPSGLLTDDGDFTYNANTNTITVTNANVANISVSGSLTLNGNSVVTSVVPTAGNGIAITGLVSSGPDVVFTVDNIGVLSLIAGSGITISNATGNITISSSGADFINTVGVTADYTADAADEYIGVDSTSLVTITLPTGIAGRVYTIKDEHGTGFGKINVVGTGGELVDGVTPYVISIPHASISVVFRAGGWHIM